MKCSSSRRKNTLATRWCACNECRCVIMAEGKSRERKRSVGSRALLFMRSLSVTMCSLDRVNILLSSARPRTIKSYASARWLVKIRISYNRVAGLISSCCVSSHLEFFGGTIIDRSNLFTFLILIYFMSWIINQCIYQ